MDGGADTDTEADADGGADTDGGWPKLVERSFIFEQRNPHIVENTGYCNSDWSWVRDPCISVCLSCALPSRDVCRSSSHLCIWRGDQCRCPFSRCCSGYHFVPGCVSPSPLPIRNMLEYETTQRRTTVSLPCAESPICGDQGFSENGE